MPKTIREHLISSHILRRRNVFQIGLTPLPPPCIQTPYHTFLKYDWLNIIRELVAGDLRNYRTAWQQEQLPLNQNCGKDSCPLFFSFCMSSAMSGEYKCPYNAHIQDNWTLFCFMHQTSQALHHSAFKRSALVHMNYAHMCFLSVYACAQHANCMHSLCIHREVLGNSKTALTPYPRFEMHYVFFICVNL